MRGFAVAAVLAVAVAVAPTAAARSDVAPAPTRVVANGIRGLVVRVTFSAVPKQWDSGSAAGWAPGYCTTGDEIRASGTQVTVRQSTQKWRARRWPASVTILTSSGYTSPSAGGQQWRGPQIVQVATEIHVMSRDGKKQGQVEISLARPPSCGGYPVPKTGDVWAPAGTWTYSAFASINGSSTNGSRFPCAEATLERTDTRFSLTLRFGLPISGDGRC
jgi:hypothetical protein